MRRYKKMAALWIISLPGVVFRSGADDFFPGGSYDGYDQGANRSGLYVLCVNNASGATDISDTRAALNGSLTATSSGEPATVWVFWGPTDVGTEKGLWTNNAVLGDHAEGQSVFTNVILDPRTTYYYRYYATNGAGDGWAPFSSSFTTLSEPDVNNGRGAIPVGETVATLHGILAGGISAAIVVYWGQDTNAWSGTNTLGLLGEGPFATPVSGLDPGEAYYYRCRGTNIYGEDWSDVAAFTTRVGNASFAGGGYDGYGLRSSFAGVYHLAVLNAAGATNILSSSAWLNGILVSTSNGEPAVVKVYWGAEDAGTDKGLWNANGSFGDCSEGQFLTTNVSVGAGTYNFYRFYASNAAGEAWAPTSASFVTPGVPVLDTGRGATPVDVVGAALHGRLIAGVSATISVMWGQNSNAWSGTNNLGPLGHGAFVTPVAGLNPGAIYHYRCYGTNADGEGWSGLATFTTRVGSASFAGGIYDGYDKSFGAAGLVKENRGNFIWIR